MDKVSVFESSDFGELRIIVDPKGDVWFVASDVAKSLGYINAKDAVKRHVDDDDSILLQVSDNQWGVNQSLLKTRYIYNIRIINESGLYSLILSSKLESAKRFKRWITSEVLPSIRKTGEYKTSSGGKGILVPDFSNPKEEFESMIDYLEVENEKPVDMGEVSDGYHTFNELYRYRMLHNAAFFNLLARNGQVEVCKSRRHSDGEKCFGSDDWFIVMAILPTGQVSNHYKSKYWDLFDVLERETAFEYDGHTPNEAADRLEQYLNQKKLGM